MKDYLLYIISIIITIGFLGFIIFIFIKYGQMNPQETPNWVHWIIYRK